MPKSNAGVVVNSGLVARPPRPFVAGGDLTGTPTLQTVTGIQNVPVSTAVPGVGEVLSYTGTEWAPQAGGGGGGFIPGADLTGTSTAQTVSFIQGVVSMDPALHANRDLVEVVETPMFPGSLVVPRAMVTDGSHLYVGQSYGGPANSSPGAHSPLIWKLQMSGATVVDSRHIDLSTFDAGIDRVRDLAQDATYLYAACWTTGDIAVIDKVSFTVVGWASTGGGSAISVCADGIGNFYCYEDGGPSIQKFLTAVCLGAPPGAITFNQQLPTATARWVRFGGGKIWLANGNNSEAALSRVDPVTMTLEASTPDLNGDTSSMVAVYAFPGVGTGGAVWVSSVVNPGIVYRVNEVTLSVEATVDTTIGISFSGSLGIIGGMEVGPNSAGTPSSWLWCSAEGASYTMPVDPLTNATALPGLAPLNTADGVHRCHEGICAIGNYVYAACFGGNESFGGGEGSPNVDYYAAITAVNGHISPLTELTDWTLRYRTIGGDILGPVDSLTVTGIQHTPVDASGIALGRPLTVEQVSPPFGSPQSVAMDTAFNRIVVADSANPYMNTYNLTTGVYKKGTSSNAHLGLTKVIADTQYAYALGTSSVPNNYGVIIFNLSDGTYVGTGKVVNPRSCVLDGSGNLWVVGSTGLFKFVISFSNILGRNNWSPDASLSISNATDVAWDGSFLYVTDGANGHVYKVNPAGPSISATYTDSSGRDMAGIFATGPGTGSPNTLWVTTRRGQSVVSIATAGMTLIGAVDFSVATPSPVSLYAISGTDGFQMVVSDQLGSGVYKFLYPVSWPTQPPILGSYSTNLSDTHGIDFAVQDLGFGFSNRWSAVPSSSPTPYITSYELSVPFNGETTRFGDGPPYAIKYAASTIGGVPAPTVPGGSDAGKSIVVTGPGTYALGNTLAVPKYTAVTSAYTAHPGEVVPVNTTGGPVTVTLPVLSSVGGNTVVVIKCMATSANACTVAAGSGNTIEGGASFSLAPTSVKVSVILVADVPNNNWIVVGRYV
jgi:hypothetical protein